MNMELKPYKGYVVLLRAILLLLLRDKPSFSGLGAFIAIVIECDWDSKHATYGCLTKSDLELALRWNCDVTTIWRHKKRLLQMGLLIKNGESIKVKDFAMFDLAVAKKLAKIPFANMQDLIAKVQEPIAQLQEKIANLQSSQDQNQPQSSNVSSKSDLSLSKEDSYNTSITDEELDRITREIDEQLNK